MRGLFFRADSTFPKDTYSPACSFTRSFLRSENRKWRIGMLCLTEQQTFLWRISSLLDDSELTHPQSVNNHLDELPRHLQYKTSAAPPHPPRSCHFLPPPHSQSIPRQHSVHQSKSPLVGVARPDWCIHLMMKERGRLKVRNVKWTWEPSIAGVVCTCVCVCVSYPQASLAVLFQSKWEELQLVLYCNQKLNTHKHKFERVGTGMQSF